MHALIDGDIIVYRVGFASQAKDPSGAVTAVPEGIACSRVAESVEGILASVKASQATVFLTSSDKSNFRYALYPEYKANRTAPKPLHYDLLREYLTGKLEAVVVTGMEADDAIGIMNHENPDKCIICSIDKDLDQLPGNHYNFVRGLLYHVTPEAGLKFFYEQLLKGDRTDNIPGIPGIGDVKARKALQRAATEPHLFAIARKMYQEAYPDTWEDVMRLNGRLLKIRTRANELWDFPQDEQPVETEPVPISEAA